jgi:EAL domain-containing protein (putative c-di-GMP-specific phosphodiesterase class I)
MAIQPLDRSAAQPTGRDQAGDRSVEPSSAGGPGGELLGREPSRPPQPKGHEPTARVFVVDDEPGVRRVFSRVLSRAGFHVTEAGDGAEALSVLDRERFDVILSDISMPGLSGVALLEAVRQRDLTTQVVFATGNPSLETAMRAVELGAVRYLTKPVEHSVLIEVVREAVRLHRLARLKQEAMALVGSRHPLALDRIGLRTALDRVLAEPVLHFQPVVRCSTRSVWGYEALLRPREAALSTPTAVLEAAEQLGLLRTLGRQIRAAAAVAARRLPGETRLLVNLHPAELADPELTDPGAPLSTEARRVILEVTERAALSDSREVERAAAVLSSLGFGVAVDDLGAGYAGLVSFLQLHPTVAKLDMELVRSVDLDVRRRVVIQAIVKLCRELQVDVIVEGVETRGEHDALLALGCDLMQGYFFALPTPDFAPVPVGRFE